MELLESEKLIHWNSSHFETLHYNAKPITSFIWDPSSFNGLHINLSE